MLAPLLPRWTGERSAELERLWREGWSAGKIGIEMGLTRNSIIGKAHRMGLTAKDKPDTIIGLPRKGRTRTHYARWSDPTVTRECPVMPPRVSPPVKPVSLDLTLEELTSKTCKYPYGDKPPYRFCGATSAESSPYCRFHAALCVNVVATRKRKIETAPRAKVYRAW